MSTNLKSQLSLNFSFRELAVDPWFIKNKNDNSIRQMISEEFDCFFKKNVLPYGTEGREISLVGSIAYYYEDLVRESAKNNKIEIK